MSLADYRGKKNVVLSFVPAAWTPVCSDQWPGYNIVQDIFEENNAVLLGISVDNIPTLHSWTNQMGKLWFEVLSDFWPHGETAGKYGVLFIALTFLPFLAGWLGPVYLVCAATAGVCMAYLSARLVRSTTIAAGRDFVRRLYLAWGVFVIVFVSTSLL